MNRKTYKEIKSLLAVRPAYTQTEIGRMVGMAQPNISLVHTTKNFKSYKQHIRDVWAQQVKRKEFESYVSLSQPEWIMDDTKTIVTKIKRHMSKITRLLNQIWPKNE